MHVMSKKGLRDILCACVIILMLPCSAFIIRGMSMPYDVMAGVPQDSLSVDTSIGHDSLPIDTTVTIDTFPILDSLALTDSLAFPDSLSRADTLRSVDSTAADSAEVLTERDLRRMARDSARKRKDAYLDSVAAVKQAYRDSIHHIRDSIKAFKDSVRLSKPRVLETGFVPDSLYYKRVMSWTTGPYVNEYKEAYMDTTFNDWYTEYPFYKEDVDAVYLGTVGSATQSVNFFRRREFDIFKAYAPYLTYSHTPEDMPFFNTKSPYTELAYWGTLFAFKDREELNVRFMHTQNITPEWNLAVLFQGWKAAGMLEREATSNNSLEITTNYLGKHYVMNAGFIHHNINREENGGIQDSYMVRDTTVEAKTIAVNLQDAQNKLSRNTFFISHSYDIPLEPRHVRLRKAMDNDSSLAAAVDSIIKVKMDAYDAAFEAAVQAALNPPLHLSDSSSAQVDSTSVLPEAVNDTITSGPNILSEQEMIEQSQPVDDSLLRASIADSLPPPTEEEILNSLADSLLFGKSGEDPLITIGHIGEVSRYYRYYTDRIAANDEVGRNFYNNMFYVNPTISADSTRVLTVDNKLFFRLQPWSRDAIVSQISGGVGYRWNSIYAFRPEMFLTGNRNVNQHNLYVYAGAAGVYKKYLNWSAGGSYYLLGYNQHDFNVDAQVGVSFYPFKDKSEPITLSGRFSTSLKEPDWYSQHYYSNHYVWDNSFGKTSTTKVEAALDIPKWRLEAGFDYALVNNYLYHDTLGIVRQHGGLINVMSAYVRKDFKLWWFHLDNEVLFQYSSDRSVLPLPMLTFHLRYYIEIEAVKNVLTLQLGADARMHTLYYAPAYNPALGTFQLQTREQLGYNPYIDLFLNMQWKRVNVFLKVVNIGEGWPDGGSVFSAYHYIKPPMSFKVGIHWPFYIE